MFQNLRTLQNAKFTELQASKYRQQNKLTLWA